MTELEIKILTKRRELRNLIARSDAMRRDLNYLNSEIEKETRELALLERSHRIEVLIDRIREEGKLEETKGFDIDNLKKIFNTLGREDVEILYKELHKT